jgi:cytochrome c biogenesis protein CcmG/thiol:disulfide interchange protein DsbE
VTGAPAPSRSSPHRLVIAALAIALVTTVGVVVLVVATRQSAGAIAVGEPAPAIGGTTLDGQPFALADLRGRPVIVNFWGPSCVPCRSEFPLFLSKLDQHASDGLAIVGVLMSDPPDPARDFISEHGATWPTVEDPGSAIRNAYRVAARPQSYFIDRDGILRSIQVGELRDADFERQYAKIVSAGSSGSPAPASPGGPASSAPALPPASSSAPG